MVKKAAIKVMPPKKSKAGQPSKFEQSKRIIEIQTAKGETDRQISDLIGVREETYCNWKKAHPEYFKSIKEIKKESDRDVVVALRTRALGFSRMVKKPITVSDGSLKGCHVEIHEFEEYYAPDVKACEIWLTNRQPDDWKKIKHIDITTKGGKVGQTEIVVVPTDQCAEYIKALENK